MYGKHLEEVLEKKDLEIIMQFEYMTWTFNDSLYTCSITICNAQHNNLDRKNEKRFSWRPTI